MTGYILTEEQADAVLDAIAQAFIVRDLPQFWTPGKNRIHTGDHAGMWIVPADDQICDTPLMGNPPMTPRDFPEFAQLIESLGGLEARQEIDASTLIDPNAPDEL